MLKKNPSKKEQINYYDVLYEDKAISMSPWNKKISEYLITRKNKKSAKVFDVGCGKGDLLYYLTKNGYDQKNMSGIDLSSVGAKTAKKLMPKGYFEGTSLYEYKTKEKYDYIILAEVIEHLEDFHKGVDCLTRLLNKNGEIIVSFPNYFNLPWLGVRLASEFFNKPNWIVLQPIDRIYTYSYIKKQFAKRGLSLTFASGVVYLPPVLFQYENNQFLNIMNKLKLQPFAFHPIMAFKK